MSGGKSWLSFPDQKMLSFFRESSDKVIKDRALQRTRSRTFTTPTGPEKNGVSVSRRLSQTESRDHSVS